MVKFNDVITLISNLLTPTPSQQITAANHRTVETAILNFAKDQWLVGDLKMIDCTNEYITANFETSGPTQGRGLPGGDRDGWAICNGLNNTMNRTGRVPLAWGNVAAFDQNGWDIRQLYIKLNGQPVFSGNNGEAITIAQMPTHNHLFPGDDWISGGNGYGGWTNRTVSSFPYDANSRNSGGGQIYRTSDTGGGNAHNNLQPYMVTLFIQKI
jgi:hypothetical protein